MTESPLKGWIPDIPSLGWEGGALKEGPGTGVCLAAEQTRSSEGAGPVADQISGDVGPTHEQQRGEAKAEATRRRKAAASPPGPPLEKTQKTEALGLETLKTEALGLETLKTEVLGLET